MSFHEKQKKVILVDDADESFMVLAQGTSKQERQLVASIQRAMDLLNENPFAGDAISRKLWPREYGVLTNLFRMELSQFWRLLYYVKNDGELMLITIFEICDHKKYDKIFGY